MLTSLGWRLPFNMSSTPKGSPWRPAMLAFIEDAGAIEGQGGVKYRMEVMKRYEMSARFRRMILLVNWAWGLGLLGIAIISTVLIMVLNENIGFGVGWGLSWAFSAGWVILTLIFVRGELRKEKEEWIAKGGLVDVPLVGPAP